MDENIIVQIFWFWFMYTGIFIIALGVFKIIKTLIKNLF